MRSRYAAFAIGDADHLLRTWHPRNRPAEVESATVRWTGLTVIDTSDGGAGDAEGTVEFLAGYEGTDGKTGQLQERSRFIQRAGRWMYLDANG